MPKLGSVQKPFRISVEKRKEKPKPDYDYNSFVYKRCLHSFWSTFFLLFTSKVWNYLCWLLDPTLEGLTKFKAKYHSHHALQRPARKMRAKRAKHHPVMQTNALLRHSGRTCSRSNHAHIPRCTIARALVSSFLAHSRFWVKWCVPIC